jgi:hypothetical protein
MGLWAYDSKQKKEKTPASLVLVLVSRISGMCVQCIFCCHNTISIVKKKSAHAHMLSS